MEATLNGPFGQTMLGTGVVTLGRAPDNQLSLNDAQASSHHAEIRPEGQGYALVDRGSTNGTFVNEQRIDSNVPRPLKAGDRIRIGGMVFTYQVSGGSFAEETLLANGSDKTVMAGPAQGSNMESPPAFGAMPPNYPQPQGYPQQPPNYPQQQPAAYPQQALPNYPQQQLPAYPQQAPQGYPQQQPPAYPQQVPQGYPQQPPFPGQPIGTVPGVPPSYQQPVARKKSRAGCVIAVLVVLVLLAAGVAFAYFRIPAVQGLLGGSTPDKTVTNYCSDLNKGDYHAAYQQLSARAQSQTSEQKFVQTFQSASGILGTIQCNSTAIQQNGSTATATMTYNFSKIPAVHGKLELVNENGTWKIDSGQSVNQPSQP